MTPPFQYLNYYIGHDLSQGDLASLMKKELNQCGEIKSTDGEGLYRDVSS